MTTIPDLSGYRVTSLLLTMETVGVYKGWITVGESFVATALYFTFICLFVTCRWMMSR